jgi:CheY-like chemotaxis protein
MYCAPTRHALQLRRTQCTFDSQALVCEDVPLNLDVLLSHLQLRVVTAHNSEDALATVYKRKRPFDIVFIDCSMPVTVRRVFK